MVEERELTNLLIKEKVKAIYDSIDTKELNRLEQKEQEYREYIKKDYHPMSYQIDKEIEEWEASAPIFEEYHKAEIGILAVGFAYLTMWVCISMIVIVYALTS